MTKNEPARVLHICPECGQGSWVYPKTPIIPIVKGGQGKSDEEPISAAAGICWGLLWGLLCWVILWLGWVAV